MILEFDRFVLLNDLYLLGNFRVCSSCTRKYALLRSELLVKLLARLLHAFWSFNGVQFLLQLLLPTILAFIVEMLIDMIVEIGQNWIVIANKKWSHFLLIEYHPPLHKLTCSPTCWSINIWDGVFVRILYFWFLIWMHYLFIMALCFWMSIVIVMSVAGLLQLLLLF